MRDKRRDKEYFDYCIRHHSKESEKLKAEINSYTDQSDPWVLAQKNHLLHNEVNILTAKYSRGDPLSDLKKEFEQLTDCFMKSWVFDEKRYHLFNNGLPLNYIHDLRFASLALLLNMDIRIKDKIGKKLKEALYYDCLIESILSDTDDLPDKESLTYPDFVPELVCAANSIVVSHWRNICKSGITVLSMIHGITGMECTTIGANGLLRQRQLQRNSHSMMNV